MSTFSTRLKRVGFWGLVLVFLLIITSLVKSLLSYMKVDDRFFQAEKQVEELNIEKSELEKQLYKEDESYVVERELRDSLGLSKEGESVVVLPEELVEKTIQERNEEKEVIENIPNWKKWWNIFFDKP